MKAYSTFFGEGPYRDRQAEILKHKGKWYIILNGEDLVHSKAIEVRSEEEGENIAEDFCLGFRDN